MTADPLYVQLLWEDPQSGKVERPCLPPPVALGREVAQMPETLGSQTVSRLELNHGQISRFHALITVANKQLYITDRSANGTFLNGRPVRKGSQIFSSRDTLRIGPYKITVSLTNSCQRITTDLTIREQTASLPASPIHPKNTLFVWFLGLLILLVTGFGSWVVLRFLLEQVRPSPLPAQSSQTSVD